MMESDTNDDLEGNSASIQGPDTSEQIEPSLHEQSKTHTSTNDAAHSHETNEIQKKQQPKKRVSLQDSTSVLEFATSDNIADDEDSESIAEEPCQFADVEEILKKGGFHFDKNLFCRPRGNPGENEKALKNKDYFETEEVFRTHLCQFGVDNSASWEEDDKKKIYDWVRMNIIRSADLRHILPEHHRFEKDSEATSLLERIGFTCQKIANLECYCFPGIVDAKQGDLRLPESSDFSNIGGDSGTKRLSLEVNLTQMLTVDETL